MACSSVKHLRKGFRRGRNVHLVDGHDGFAHFFWENGRAVHCADNCADHGGDGIGVVSDVDAHLDGGQGICISGGQNAEHTGNRFICSSDLRDDVAELQHRVFPSKTLAGDGNGKLHPLFHTGNRDGLSVPGAFARAVEACVKYLRKACAGYGSADGRGNGAGRRKRGGIVMRWLAERDCVLDGAFRMAGIFQSGRENFHGRAVGGAGVVAGQNDREAWEPALRESF